MTKLNYVTAFVFGVLATVITGSTVSANTFMNDQNTSYGIASTSIEAECAAPLNRSYHDVLSAYNDDNSDDYKFSGCGGVI